MGRSSLLIRLPTSLRRLSKFFQDFISHSQCVMALLVMLSAVSCTGSSASARTPASTVALPTLGLSSARYVDPIVGFSVQLPLGWTAHTQPGKHPSSFISELTLTSSDEASQHQLIQLGVFHGAAQIAEFHQRGVPTAFVGPYPAFVADRGLSDARVPCLVRLFLAQSDYVIAEWCAMDAFAHAQAFDQILATYRPAPDGYLAQPVVAPAAQTCARVEASFGYSATEPLTWGRQLATPLSGFPAFGWDQLAPGAYVCSNIHSHDQYLFQCTELVNRFLSEQWALPHLPGNAARYYDYYQDGVFHPGVIRDVPSSAYQLSDDASQGMSRFPPRAGDLLIFQDVHDPQQGWTSGLIMSPGHVALITGVDATHVYIAQENYNDNQYFEALAFTQGAQGYHISDRSGIPSRIVRGWIHLTSTGGADA